MQWAGVLLVNLRGEILLNLRDDNAATCRPNRWDVIGGVVEEGETPGECILRETMEETGEMLSSIRAFKVYDVPWPDGGRTALHMYSAGLDKPAVELVLGEGREHRFFAVEEFASIEIVRGIETVLSDFVASEDYRVLTR